MNKKLSWEIKAPFLNGLGYSLSMAPNMENAGEFVLMKTKPAYAILARFEVFGFVFKGSPIFQGSMMYLGSDVSFSCEVSRFPEGASLQLEIEGGPTSNSTLYINNTVQMVIQSVDQNYKGVYKCKFSLNGKNTFTISSKLNVKTSSYSVIMLFRESSKNSKVNMMCRSSPGLRYQQAQWIKSTSAKEKLGVSNNRESMDKFGRNQSSFPVFNGTDFPLQISPLAFENGGEFKCYIDGNLIVAFKLTTIQVSASEVPIGSHPVVLKCELSEVSGDSVILGWLRMNGSRGLLVKQEVLTENHPNRTLSLTLTSLRSDQLHWQCVVFTKGMLRAGVPLILQGATGSTGLTESIPSTSNMRVIVSCCTALVAAGILLVLLVFYLKRKRTEPAVTSQPLTHKTEPVYDNITDPQPDHESPRWQTEADEEVHYSEFMLGEPGLDPKIVEQLSNWEREAVIYSTLKIT
ncbi:uncharacterized protein LOC105026256 isoform X3 [Esox lucius]|uniref:uncharacterized protein LOC105026256 isoform X3 n=1 Tax=Esox lucius TaxID=8010 RepID=UPI0014768F49|nr:uncharacterized protein LOC105026256 isoform X3 [Esox lucius]